MTAKIIGAATIDHWMVSEEDGVVQVVLGANTKTTFEMTRNQVAELLKHQPIECDKGMTLQLRAGRGVLIKIADDDTKGIITGLFASVQLWNLFVEALDDASA